MTTPQQETTFPTAFTVDDVRRVMADAKTPLSTTEIGQACAELHGGSWGLADALKRSTRAALDALVANGELVSVADGSDFGDVPKWVLPSWHHGRHRYYWPKARIEEWGAELRRRVELRKHAEKVRDELREAFPVAGDKRAMVDVGHVNVHGDTPGVTIHCELADAELLLRRLRGE